MGTELLRDAVMRLTIVIRSDLAAKANAAAASEDKAGGDKTFTVPLAQASDPITPVAYWCSWDFSATKSSVNNLKTFLTNQGFTLKALGADGAGAAVNADKSIAYFDGDVWTPEAVLAKVGLQTIAPAAK